MKFSNIKYYLKESIISIFRNRLMSVASIVTVAGCILIFALSFCVISNLDYILKSFESEMTLSVYVDDSLPEKELDDLEKRLLEIEHVESVNYISSQEAMEIFSKEYSDGKEDDFLTGLDAATDDILPRSFDIHVDEITNQGLVKAELEKMVGNELEKVQYDKDSIEFLISINNFIRIASIVMILFLGIVSIVIIMNTIKLTVNLRKNEINIMKYVGATDWFIRWPFIIEGMIIGFIGALIPIIISWAGYGQTLVILQDKMPALLSLVEFKSRSSVFTILIPVSIVMGIAIGAIGSVTSIKKHLLV